MSGGVPGTPARPEILEVTPWRVLAVYAHPDDPEISCGGLLARTVAAGGSVVVVTVTRGEKGSDDPATDPVVLAGVRAAEAERAARVLGADEHRGLGWADGELDDGAALRGEIVRLVREVRPEVVVAPDPTAVFFGGSYVNHRDHRAVGWAVLDAVAPDAASPLYHRGEGEPHAVSTLLLSGTLEPDVVVDIAPALDTKVAAVACHESQLAGADPAFVEEMVLERALAEGARVGLGPAESFRRLRLR